MNYKGIAVSKLLPALAVRQHTLAGEIGCAGVGLHFGQSIRLTLKPAPVNSGVCFVRTDISTEKNRIAAIVDNVCDTKRGTSIANSMGAVVSTIEHLMAALMAMGIDNALIEVDGAELPAMDGSAAVFVKMISQAGFVEQAAPKKYIRVLREIVVKDGASIGRLSAHDRFEVDVGISYQNPVIGTQSFCLDVNPNSFVEEIASARTFALRSEVEAVLRSGKGAGGNLDNCIVVGENQVENDGGLRLPNEFARHKAIDALGDLSLAGAFILGRYHVRRAGHRINNLVLQALMKNTTAWETATFE